MKSQYFGDINDYRKYGLLRTLSYQGAIRTAVCWMLTPDDDLGHGARTDYLQDPDRWQPYDAELFDSLAQCLTDPDNRHVKWAETSGILPSTVFYPNLLTDNAEERQEYFRQFLRAARDCDLVFFDPDNGLEVKSKPYGRKGSCKYLYWHELVETYQAGHSVLVYQHFRREKRDPFIEAQSARICEETGASEVLSFRTAHVLFLLAPQPRHYDFFHVRSPEVAQQWASQIRVVHRQCSQQTDATSQHVSTNRVDTNRSRPGGRRVTSVSRKRLAQLRQAYEIGILDEDTFQAAVSALETKSGAEARPEVSGAIF